MIVQVIGVPMDLGSGRRGVDMGPSAIRIAGLHDRLSELGHDVVDDGDIDIKNIEERPPETSTACRSRRSSATARPN